MGINWAYNYLYLFFKTSTIFCNFCGIAGSGTIYGYISILFINHHFDDEIRIKNRKKS